MSIAMASTASVASELREVLEAVHSLGVRTTGTRFAQYATVLEERGDGWRKLELETPDQKAESRLWWEAASQAIQISAASRCWPALNRDSLREKLRIVVKGAADPPSGTDDDKPRNTLLELVVASLLAAQGLSVHITDDVEDLQLELPPLGLFPVECKRPTQMSSLENNLKKVRRQLRTRLSEHSPGGIAVIGTERIERANSDFLAARHQAHLELILEKSALAIRGKIWARHLSPRPFFPEIPAAAAAFCGPVLMRDSGSIVSVAQLSLFLTTPNASEGTDIAAAFSGAMPTTAPIA